MFIVPFTNFLLTIIFICTTNKITLYKYNSIIWFIPFIFKVGIVIALNKKDCAFGGIIRPIPCICGDDVEIQILFPTTIGCPYCVSCYVYHDQSSPFSCRMHSKAAMEQFTWVAAVPLP